LNGWQCFWIFLRMNIKNVLLAAAASIFTITLTGCELDSEKKLGDGHDFGENDENVVVAIGDSITDGGFSGAAPWPSRLGMMSGKTVLNYGVPGAKSTEGAGRIGSILARNKPGYVIIWFGANDAIMDVSLQSTENALRYMIDQAKANNSIPIIATVMPMAGGRVIFNGNVDRINEVINGFSDVEIVDTHGVIAGSPELYLADGLHLNDAGEQEIAATFNDLF